MAKVETHILIKEGTYIYIYIYKNRVSTTCLVRATQ